jgi:tetratricopeptide (TPR) repeat protein
MEYTDYQDLLDSAREYYIEGDYKRAEPILHQILLRNNRIAEVFLMLATIYYEHGKFTKSINTFKRALEVDPTYADASIGLSIVLNDLGRYEEGQTAFDEAQILLQKKKTQADPFLDEKLSAKHAEIGDLYFQYSRWEEAVEQYYKAVRLTLKKMDLLIKIADAFVKKGEHRHAVRELKNVVRDYPQFIPARIKLGIVLYNSQNIQEAVQVWEAALTRDPDNKEAQNFIRIAQRSGSSRATAPSLSPSL